MVPNSAKHPIYTCEVFLIRVTQVVLKKEHSQSATLREKYLLRKSPYSARIQKNADQK